MASVCLIGKAALSTTTGKIRRIPPACRITTSWHFTRTARVCSRSARGLAVLPIGIRARGRLDNMARAPTKVWQAGMSTRSPRTRRVGCGSGHSVAVSIVSPHMGPTSGPLADPHAAHPITLRPGTATPGGLSDDKVMALLTDHDGFVWAGTMEGGLDRISTRSLSVTVFSHDANDPNTLGAAGVMSLLEDSSGRLWVGT